MKIGIVTIVSYNLGNRLQNYALQQVLAEYGVVETVPLAKKSRVKIRLSILFKKLLTVIGKKKRFFWDEFDLQINWGKLVYGLDNARFDGEYDYLVAGSDQIWNPVLKINSDREFLTYVSSEKRIAYAASIGLDQLPENQKERFTEALRHFRAISVREDTAADIIEGLIGIRPPVVVDPTMLLSVEKWRELAGSSRADCNGKYVLKYFLGLRNAEYEEYMDQFAEQIGANIMDISTKTKDGKDVPVQYGPCDFLRLIDNAAFIFTDSFHATVFSLLFEKQFLVFSRPARASHGSMGSRLTTLAQKFGIETRIISGKEQLHDQLEPVDYKKVKERLSAEKDLALKYLDDALL